MIVIQAAALIIAVMLAATFLIDWYTDRHDRIEQPELTELDVQQIVHPDGNVHLIERHPPTGEDL